MSGSSIIEKKVLTVRIINSTCINCQIMYSELISFAAIIQYVAFWSCNVDDESLQMLPIRMLVETEPTLEYLSSNKILYLASS